MSRSPTQSCCSKIIRAEESHKQHQTLINSDLKHSENLHVIRKAVRLDTFLQLRPSLLHFELHQSHSETSLLFLAAQTPTLVREQIGYSFHGLRTRECAFTASFTWMSAQTQSISTLYQLFLLPACFNAQTGSCCYVVQSHLTSTNRTVGTIKLSLLFCLYSVCSSGSESTRSIRQTHKKINQHDRLCPLPKRVPLHSHLGNSYSV